MRKILSLFLLLLPLMGHAASPQEEMQEIQVHLLTEDPLIPLYLGKIEKEDTPFTAGYLQTLQEILAYDLGHNGSHHLLPSDPQKEELFSKKEAAFAQWKAKGVRHLVQARCVKDALSATIYSVQPPLLKQMAPVTLSGMLAQDRDEIHKLADRIHRAFFNEEGIAHSRILYSFQSQTPKADGSGWTAEIWECDWDGANARQVTKEGSYAITPVFLPSVSHSRQFLYVSYKEGQPKIYGASLKEGRGKRLLSLRGNQLLPALSPKKDKLAFICDAGGRTDLFLSPFPIPEEEKPVQLFSYPRSTQASPTFSPDGSQIAFVSDKDGSPRIYLLSAKRGLKRETPKLLSKKNRESSCPAWSPDGKKIAYSAKTSGVRQIWIYDVETQEETPLTSGPGNKENPAWAPNSLHLVFNSTDATSSDLYIVNLRQPKALRITKGPGKKHYPTWGMR